MTQAEFSSYSEFIHAGKPVLCFPHFGDQAMGTKKLVEAGAAISIIEPSLAEGLDHETSSSQFEKPLFTADDVSSLFHQLLSNPTFRAAMLRSKCQAVAAGGGSKAVSLIEDAYVQHLMSSTDEEGYKYVPYHVTKDFLTISRSAGCCKLLTYLMLITGLITYLCVHGFPGIISLLEPYLA